MEMKNMAYWKAKNGNSPLKQKQVAVREGAEYKNPKGESQADIIDKRNKAAKSYSDKVTAYSEKHGLTKDQASKAEAKLKKLNKATRTSADSIAAVNKAMDIKIAKQKKSDAGDLFD
jgi:hypothetical protein